MRANGRTAHTRERAGNAARRAQNFKTQARWTTATSWTSTFNGRRLVECRARGSSSSAQTQWRASSLTTQDKQCSHSRQLHQQNSSGGYRRHAGRHDSTLAASLPLEDLVPLALCYETLEAGSRQDGAAAPAGDAVNTNNLDSLRRSPTT